MLSKLAFSQPQHNLWKPLLSWQRALRPRFMTMDRQTLPTSDIPIFTDLRSYRQWRDQARKDDKTVGFVPTMGALHDGHLMLVHKSLSDNDLTVVSIFVNPAQFAPHEDLSTYPRTLTADLAALATVSYQSTSLLRKASAVFLPSVQDMYPSGISQDVASQKGTFVEVKGYGEQMEGRSRPTFFRGVATIVTKLFNAVEPTRAYFGQKDIQQALLLRRMVQDLLLSHPTPENLHVVPTYRDSVTGLALSSRNAYMTEQEAAFAPALYKALRSAESYWNAGATKEDCVVEAVSVIQRAAAEAATKGVDLRVDYVEMNDSGSFEILKASIFKSSTDAPKHPVIVSGAMWVGRTRLIDNVLLNEDGKLLSRR